MSQTTSGTAMTGLPRRHWMEMTTEQFRALDGERVIALLPVGAIEQHGPHLPVCVDACINQGIVDRALELMPSALPVTVLPMQAVGKSDEHRAFAGTLSLSAATLGQILLELGGAVARAGVRKLVLFNSHGGQPQVLEIAARELRGRHDMLAVAHSWYSMAMPEGLFPAEELRHGIHAGAVETSMMLHLRPDLVDMELARDCRSLGAEMAADFHHLGPTGGPSGAARFGWLAQDLHPAGACGDATNADAERGRALIERAAETLVEVLAEVDRFPLRWLRAAGRPSTP
jgi:creatinine amidohydrolase